MTAPHAPVTPSNKSSALWRRVAASVLIGGIAFAALWYTVFSAVTAALTASGFTVVLLAGASWSDLFESILDTLASILMTILGVIAAVFAAAVALFDW
jgi:hypothetical protein